MSTLRLAGRRSLAPAVLTAVLVGAVPLLSACADGQTAPTRQEYTVADGVQASAGNIALRDLFLTADVADHTAAKTLNLEGVVANDTGTDDALEAVTTGNLPFVPTATTPLAADAQPSEAAVPSAAPTTLPATVTPGVSLRLGTGGLGLQVTDLPTAVLPGSLVSLTFTFKVNGSVTVEVPVYTVSSRSPSPSESPLVVQQPDLPNYNEPEVDNATPEPSSTS